MHRELAAEKNRASNDLIICKEVEKEENSSLGELTESLNLTNASAVVPDS